MGVRYKEGLLLNLKIIEKKTKELAKNMNSMVNIMNLCCRLCLTQAANNLLPIEDDLKNKINTYLPIKVSL